MFEKYMVMTRGFQNIVQDGKAVGFQVRIRITYYRGVYLALLGGLDLSVDGEKYTADRLCFSFGAHTYTIDELAKEEKARWIFGEPATLTVSKPGGLKPGLHEVSLKEVIKPAYMLAFGFVAQVRKQMTLVA